MAVGCGVILSLQESLAGDLEAVWVDPAALCGCASRSWCVLAAISWQPEEL